MKTSERKIPSTGKATTVQENAITTNACNSRVRQLENEDFHWPKMDDIIECALIVYTGVHKAYPCITRSKEPGSTTDRFQQKQEHGQDTVNRPWMEYGISG